ncbi:aminoglycoside 6'-N-acetyltransferase [Devosia sp.]|uniref:aminoglycoside 6'-N-acetyltransferase n=1 Tax=Devosia sp. TaxID=1871048 RepID=UPI0032658DCD
MDRADHLGQPVITVAPATRADADVWLELRLALWPGEDRRNEFIGEISQMLADAGDTVTFIAWDDRAGAVGFVEAGLRHDFVNGCETSPVAFLEGVYVSPAYRRRGVAGLLVDTVADWGRQRGCAEFASDALLDNTQSHAMHHALGFQETQRVVYFRKVLG